MRRVEKPGYATVLLHDHFLPGSFGNQFAPLSALMAAAMMANTLRIGSMVFDNDYRHPVVLGKEVATLDVLRFEFGVGAGWAANMSKQDSRSIHQACALIVSRWHCRRAADICGKALYDQWHFWFPQPFQRPHPPILIGAGGLRMLAIAAREVDVVGILAGPLNAGAPTVNDPDWVSPQSPKWI